MEYDKQFVWHERDERGDLTGRTLAVIWLNDERFVGISKCRLDLDMFSKKKGYFIATEKAKATLEESLGRREKRNSRWRAEPLRFRFNISESLDWDKFTKYVEKKTEFTDYKDKKRKVTIFKEKRARSLPEWMYREKKEKKDER